MEIHLESRTSVDGVHKDRVITPALHVLLRLVESRVAWEAAAKVILDGVIHCRQVVEVISADGSCVVADDNSVLASAVSPAELN